MSATTLQVGGVPDGKTTPPVDSVITQIHMPRSKAKVERWLQLISRKKVQHLQMQGKKAISLIYLSLSVSLVLSYLRRSRGRLRHSC